MTKEIMDKAAERMAGAEQQLLSNFASVRTGRASAMILDRVKADYYGVPTPVNQMAAIKTPDAHTLVIEPWDKSALGPCYPGGKPGRYAQQRRFGNPPFLPAPYRGAS